MTEVEVTLSQILSTTGRNMLALVSRRRQSQSFVCPPRRCDVVVARSVHPVPAPVYIARSTIFYQFVIRKSAHPFSKA